MLADETTLVSALAKQLHRLVREFERFFERKKLRGACALVTTSHWWKGTGRTCSEIPRCLRKSFFPHPCLTPDQTEWKRPEGEKLYEGGGDQENPIEEREWWKRPAGTETKAKIRIGDKNIVGRG